MKRVLIFYISKNTGHYQAARSIEEALYTFGLGIEVKMVNTFSYTNPILGKIVTKAYLEVVKKRPEFWGNIYDNPDVLRKTKKARESFSTRSLPKIQKLVELYKPDIIYCTQAYPCSVIAAFKRKTKINLPLVGVLTDHAPHSYWLHKEVDIYSVPSEETRWALLKKGISGDRIRVNGIPIDMKYQNVLGREVIINKFGLDSNKKTVLIMGGNQGLGAVEKIVESLSIDPENGLQLMVVTGKNRRLYRKINRKFLNGSATNIKLYAYAGNIDEMMEVADLIITKAGGITTSEALSKGLPVLIVNPIPGQERMNTDYLVREGAAVEIEEISGLADVARKVLSDTGLFEKMKANAKRMAKPCSSHSIAQIAVEMV